MAKITIYVQAGWDEAEELTDAICDLLAARGKGMRVECAEDPIRAVLILANNDELNDPELDPHEWIEQASAGARAIIIPQRPE